MTILTTKEFESLKSGFFNRHDHDFETFTSSMREDGSYHKTYVFADNAQWIELMRPVYKDEVVEVCKTSVKVSVKLLEKEAWSTDDASSVFTYEQF